MVLFIEVRKLFVFLRARVWEFVLFAEFCLKFSKSCF